MKTAYLPVPTAPRQLPMALPPLMLQDMTPAERSIAIARLVRLLMEAAGVAVEENRDEER